jgi:hypothetical protein
MSIGGLPIEMWIKIALHLDYYDLINLCQVPEFTWMAYDTYIWWRKLNQDLTRSHRVDRITFERTRRLPIGRYLELMATVEGQVFYGSEHSLPITDCLIQAIYQGNESLIRYFLRFPRILPLGFNVGLYETTRHDHVDLIGEFIGQPDVDLNFGLLGAAAGGHEKWVNYFIASGATCLHWAVEEATRWGHTNLVIYFQYKMSLLMCCFCGTFDLVRTQECLCSCQQA